jgi:hypothetical protein
MILVQFVATALVIVLAYACAVQRRAWPENRPGPELDRRGPARRDVGLPELFTGFGATARGGCLTSPWATCSAAACSS